MGHLRTLQGLLFFIKPLLLERIPQLGVCQYVKLPIKNQNIYQFRWVGFKPLRNRSVKLNFKTYWQVNSFVFSTSMYFRKSIKLLEKIFGCISKQNPHFLSFSLYQMTVQRHYLFPWRSSSRWNDPHVVCKQKETKSATKTTHASHFLSRPRNQINKNS